jgi:hypothetical protein
MASIEARARAAPSSGWGSTGAVGSRTAYRSLAEHGFRYFVIQIQDSRDLETIELLGREVAPKVS